MKTFQTLKVLAAILGMLAAAAIFWALFIVLLCIAESEGIKL